MFKLSFETPAAEHGGPKKFEQLIGSIAAKTNEYLNQFIDNEKGKDIIGHDGHIFMRGFLRKKDGPFSKTGEGGVSEDEKFVLERKKIFSGIWNDEGMPDINVQKYYRDTFGCDNEEEMVARWEEGKDKTRGNVLEHALLGVLYKALNKDFVVVHSSTYDDYANGVDYVIVNKETGDVACAFDGVNDDKGGERYEKKIKKIRQKSNKEGAVLKYGLTFETEDGKKKLVKKELKNIPIFCLSLSTGELEKLLGSMNYDLVGGLSSEESKVFSGLVESLRSQTENLEKASISERVRNNLEKFKNSLRKMEEIKNRS